MTTDNVTVPSRGLIPGLIYGTAWKKDRTRALVTAALQAGFRGIDTACQPKHYDEAGVGAAVTACSKEGLQRAELFLQTKFTPVGGQDPKRIPYDPAARLAEQVQQSFAVSLRNLQTAYVDSLILHSPLEDTAQTQEVWEAFEAIARSGRARQLGISNCYDVDVLADLHRSAKIKPTVVQNRFYADTAYDQDIRVFCKQHSIVYQSFWTLSANPHLLTSKLMQSLAKQHRRTAAQILFRYLTQAGIVPLTGTTSAAHMREDLAIFEFELAEAERDAIDKLL